MSREESLKRIIQSHGRADCVHRLVIANMRLWDSWVAIDSDSGMWCSRPYTVASPESLRNCAFDPVDPFFELFIELAHEAGLLDDRLVLQRRIFDPFSFVSAIIPEEFIRAEDTRYFVRAAIRRVGRLRWNAELRQVFGMLSAATSNHSSEAVPYLQLRTRLLDTLSSISRDRRDFYVDAYVATLREFKMLVAEQPRGFVRISPDMIDTEYLISGLFGISSGIRGLDQLFGGSGPILPDYIFGAAEPLGSISELETVCLSGRTILVRGPTGSGKTLLACHLAASVAGKGGVVNIVSAEQGPEEYLYTLSTMGLLTPAAGFEIGFSEEERIRLQTGADHSRGAIVYAGVDRDGLGEGLPLLTVLAERMRLYPLRLLIIDSLNGVANLALLRDRDVDVRGAFAGAFRSIASLGVSLLVIEEEQGGEGVRFEEQQNLADTVVRLSTRTELAYRKRFIQIMKLRFQREQRGEHPFSIVSGEGIHVVPSPVAVRTRVSQRRSRGEGASPDPIGLGIGALDAIAGSPLRPGNIVLLEGVAGTRKSVVASAFLGARQAGEDVGSPVLLAIGDPAFANPPGASVGNGGTSSAEVGHPRPFLRVVRRGFSSPGTLFQLLDEILDQRLGQGKFAQRLAIDDLATLDVDAPFVAADSSFGHVLCDYLRRQDAISLLVSRTPAEGEPDLVRRAVAANSDFHFLLSHRRGERHGHVLLRVLKSPGMKHRTGWFDVSIDEDRVEIAGTPTLVDLDRHGDERPLRIILYMFTDAAPHVAYNDKVVAALQSNPNLQVEVASQRLVLGSGAIDLGGRSGYGDIRIVQLDEFQVPTSESQEGGPELYQFDAGDVPHLALYLREVVDRTRTDSTSRRRGDCSDPRARRMVWAVPYYCNIGLLALQGRTAAIVRKLFLEADPINVGFTADEQSSWRKLASHIEREDDEHSLLRWMDWQAMALLSEVLESLRQRGRLAEIAELSTLSSDLVFFDYTGTSEEDNNVLFLEILLWVRSGLNLGREEPSLEDWFRHPSALRALRVFWRLLRPAYEREERRRMDQISQDEARVGDTEVDSVRSRRTLETAAVGLPAKENSALVWRQWFTTLAESLGRLNRDEARQFVIRPLPRSCGLAGDWYLGVLADSAMPMAALRVIKTLTTPEAELERLREGIGLPTQRNYYQSDDVQHSAKSERSGMFEGDEGSPTDDQAGTEKNEDGDTWQRAPRSHIVPVSSRMTLRMSKRALRRLITRAFRRSAFSGYARKASTLSAALRRVLEFERADPVSGVAIPSDRTDSFLRGVLDDLVGQLSFIERSSTRSSSRRFRGARRTNLRPPGIGDE
jgi:KaiC/GvpD/RAD55 family RecA-like ATPase